MSDYRPLTAVSYAVAEGVATITLNRPDVLNAFNSAMMRELLDLFNQADADDAVRAIIVTGTGRAFCAGADLKEGFGIGGGEGEDFRDRGGQVALRIHACRKPVLGVINGPAAGAGATMLLAMDMRIASSNARFLFPYTRLGMVPEGCASWFLPRLVGIARALEWSLWGASVSAQDALDAGLVCAVLPLDHALALAQSRARDLVRLTSPVSVALTRQMMWRGVDMKNAEEAHLIESRLVALRRSSPDAAEGVAAFREKREPKFPQQVSDGIPPLTA